MLGLIKKDFSIVKANLKTMILIFVVYFIMMMQGNLEVSFIIPIIGIMLFITTFSYDDFNNWNAYAVTFPNGRKNVVRAKYVASIILIFILSILSLILTIITESVKKNSIDMANIGASLIGTILSVVIIVSLLYPIIFKFGSTKGRIILFTIVFAVAGIIGVIANFIDISGVISKINIIENYLYIAIPLISIALLGISYLVSNKIYKDKEF